MLDADRRAPVDAVGARWWQAARRRRGGVSPRTRRRPALGSRFVQDKGPPRRLGGDAGYLKRPAGPTLAVFGGRTAARAFAHVAPWRAVVLGAGCRGDELSGLQSRATCASRRHCAPRGATDRVGVRVLLARVLSNLP